MNSLQSAPAPQADLDDIRSLVAADMQAVNRFIEKRLASDVVLINQVARYIINSGGKRLRPLLVLLGARAAGYDGTRHVDLAAITEFIHTATLLHDDVVDTSSMRRGQETANEVWGNEASVLVGDFLYSRAFQMMVDVGNLPVMDIYAETTNVIAEGEVLQLLACHNAEISEADYLEVIRAKTAKLFEAAARVGSVLNGAPPAIEAAFSAYGRHLGTAYQLVDDLLDYQGDSTKIGKNIGDDLAEGKPTLPLIYAMRHGNAAQTRVVRDAIEEGGRERIAEVLLAVESTGAIAYTSRAAQAEAVLAVSALEVIPDSVFRDALQKLAEFSIERSY